MQEQRNKGAIMVEDKEELSDKAVHVKKEKRMPHLYEALLSLMLLIVPLAVGILIFGVSPHIPMLFGTLGAVIIAMILGYKWGDIEKFMVEGITKALSSLVIFLIIGVLIGVWISCGVVPTMIYYGLKLLKPSFFYVAALLICSITSLATGSSWGTMGTMGVALMGVGYGLGMNPAITAGAILSGAYFGDKLSPLSDTTNLAPSMAGTDIISHLKFMLPDTGVTYFICIAFYSVISIIGYSGGNADLTTVNTILDSLDTLFHISPLLLLPLVIVITVMVCKMPALPGITIGIFSAAILGLIFQPNCSIGTIFECGMNGYICETGVSGVDTLLSTGGIMNMSSSMIMIIIAMMFSGIMDGTHQFEVIVAKLKKIAHSPLALLGITELTCIVSNIVTPEQYISIVVPGSMYANEYKKRGLSPETLSGALESAGTCTSPLIPWNTCGAFIVSTLGIGAASYAPWAIFCWLSPVVCFVLGIFGVTIRDTNGKKIKGKKSEKMIFEEQQV